MIEQLFENISLEGVYKEAFQEATEKYNFTEEEAKAMESLTGLVQIITTAEKLPLQLELEVTKAELERLKDSNRKLKVKANALEEANKKLKIENDNLLGSLKAFKELSVMEDRIEAVEPKDSGLDPTFIAWVQHINNTRKK